jgi:hypothetical protein
MKSFNNALISIALAFPFIQCDRNDTKLLLINHSNATVYYKLSFVKTLNDDDVSYIPKVRYLVLRINDSVRPAFVRYGTGGWKHMINTYSKDSALHIFFFVVDTVDKYGWGLTLAMKKYDREDLTTVELDSLKWVYDYKND